MKLAALHTAHLPYYKQLMRWIHWYLTVIVADLLGSVAGK